MSSKTPASKSRPAQPDRPELDRDASHVLFDRSAAFVVREGQPSLPVDDSVAARATRARRAARRTGSS